MYVGSCEDRFSCEEIELVSREGTTVEAFENNFQQVLLIERYYRFDIEGRERERERERERDCSIGRWLILIPAGGKVAAFR